MISCFLFEKKYYELEKKYIHIFCFSFIYTWFLFFFHSTISGDWAGSPTFNKVNGNWCCTLNFTLTTVSGLIAKFVTLRFRVDNGRPLPSFNLGLPGLGIVEIVFPFEKKPVQEIIHESPIHVYTVLFH